MASTPFTMPSEHEQEIDYLGRRIDILHQEKTFHLGEIFKYDQRETQHLEEIEKLKVSVESLTSEILARNTAVLQASAEKEETEKRCRALEKVLKEKQIYGTLLENMLDNSTEAARKETDKLAKEKSDMEDMVDEIQKMWSEDLERYQTHLADMTRKYDEANRKLSEAEKSMKLRDEEFCAQTQLACYMKDDFDEKERLLKAEIAVLSEARSNLSSNVTELAEQGQKFVKDLEKAKDDVEKMQETLATRAREHQWELKQMDEVIADIRSRCKADVAKLKQRAEDAEKALAAAQNENSRLEEEASDDAELIQKLRDECNQRAKSAETHMEKIVMMCKELNDLDVLYKMQSAEYVATSKKLAESSDNEDKLKDELLNAQLRGAEFLSRMTKAQAEVGKLREQIEKAAEDVQKAEQNMNEANEKVKVLENTIESYRASIFENEVGDLKDANQSLRESNIAYQKEIEELKQRESEARAMYEESEDKVEELMESLWKESTEKTKMFANLEAVRMEYIILKDTLEANEKKFNCEKMQMLRIQDDLRKNLGVEELDTDDEAEEAVEASEAVEEEVKEEEDEDEEDGSDSDDCDCSDDSDCSCDSDDDSEESDDDEEDEAESEKQWEVLHH